jgi:hypothetical protein
VANLTNTSVDLGSVALEVWGSVDGVLQNVDGVDNLYPEGLLLARDPATGNFIPYAPASVPDRVVDVTVDVASIANATGPDTAVTVPGSLVGDLITIEPLGTWPAGLSAPQGRCLVNGTVQVRIVNVTGAPIDPVSQALRFSLQHSANALPPKYVLTYDQLVATVSTAAVTVMSAGKVNQKRLKIWGSPPTAANADHLDALLDRPIIPVDVVQQAG